MANQFGLSRNIPEGVKRAVRQRCGFGCAICGATITEYEHFFPDFIDAKQHNSERITLLCPTHHSMATKGILQKSKIQDASAHPAAKTMGYSKENHPWFEGVPSLKMGGGGLVKNTPIPIQVRGENLIEFGAPENGSNITQISANLSDASGENILKISANEWKVLSGNWDFKCIGNRYLFLDKFNDPNLILRMEPPHFIAIELFRTSTNGTPIHITEEKMMIGSNTFRGGMISGCHIGISID
jgi:hypothetical protein